MSHEAKKIAVQQQAEADGSIGHATCVWKLGSGVPLGPQLSLNVRWSKATEIP